MGSHLCKIICTDKDSSALFALLTIYRGGKLGESGQGAESHLTFTLPICKALFFKKEKRCKKNKIGCERKITVMLAVQLWNLILITSIHTSLSSFHQTSQKRSLSPIILHLLCLPHHKHMDYSETELGETIILPFKNKDYY